MKKRSSIIIICLSVSNLFAQTQIGYDIDGEFPNDYSGDAVSMPNSNTVAIGAIYNEGNGNAAGHVRVFELNCNTWVQKGEDIDSEAPENYSGYSVSMPDKNTVAIGAPINDGTGNDTGLAEAGHVRIYKWSGSNWVQKGDDIDGEATGDRSGSSVSMPDSNTVAIGAHGNDDNGAGAGHVRVYYWDGSAWVQKGADIDGEAANDGSGIFVSMPDLNTVAIGAYLNDGSGNDSGHARVFQWNGTEWMQKGEDIDGEFAGDLSGNVCMPNENIIVIGATRNDGNGVNAGHTRVFEWNGSAWIQKGDDIDGDNSWDQSGWSVSMPNANTVAIGSIQNDDNGVDAGHVRIFNWNETEWVQKGIAIDGENYRDFSGWSVSMPDSNTVAIGARGNDDNGEEAGHVRIFTFSTSENSFEEDLEIYPNPTDGIFCIDLGDYFAEVTVTVRNALGQKVLSNSYGSIKSFDVFIKGASGIYFVEINSENKKAILRVVKK